MKKKVVASLAAAMILGVAGTSFAAANPFSDVPAKHWAYASVTQLAQAGVVDGYGDGTYKGDKLITRYEMAQIVAKALARSDKATPAQKAALDKLATEFEAELNQLGARVTKLEKNQPAVQFHGTNEIRFNNKDFETGLNGNKGTNTDFRMRFEGTAKVDDKTTVGLRFVNNSAQQNANNGYDGLGQNKTWTRFGNDNGDPMNVGMDRFFINTKIGAIDTTLGRQKIVAGNTAMIMDPGVATLDGVNLKTKSGNFGLALSYGRLPATTNIATYTTTLVAGVYKTVADAVPNNQIDVKVAELSAKMGKLSATVGYLGLDNNSAPGTNRFVLNGVSTEHILDLVYGNATVLFSPKFSINTELGQNKADYATSHNKFYTVWATAGDQVLTKAKQHNFQARYYFAGANSLGDSGKCAGLNTFSEGVMYSGAAGTFTSATVHATQLYYNYAFSSNLLGQVGYYVAKSPNYVDGNYKMLRTVITAKF